MTQAFPTPTSSGVEYRPWSVLAPRFMNVWEQGQHVGVFGRTGTGKTTVAVQVLQDRYRRRDGHILALGTKLRDPVLTGLGWPIVREWPPDYEHIQGRRIIFWPPYGSAYGDKKKNAAAFARALDWALQRGGWTVYLDEAIYFTETLRLRSILDEYWNTARSANVTLVATSQGVTWIPRAMRTQLSWIIVFQVRDEETRMDVARVAGDRELYGPLSALRGHQFLLVSAESGEAYVSEVGT